MKNRLKDVHSLNVHYYVILILKRHPELDSGSVRGQEQEKARCEMLKFAIEREQSQACLNYAERKQIERS